jgi:hypothetical protein
MSYLLDKTNNASIKITVPDGTIDNTSTSLSLIGRAFVGWGEAINENFLALMENFADSTPPRNALVGQIWYDSTVAKLKYFDGSTFNTLAVYPPLTEGFLYNNNANAVQWLSAASLAPTISAAIFPTNSTNGLNAYLQRTSTGTLTWVIGTSLLTDALPAGDGFLTKNANGTYSLTAANTIATTAQLTSAAYTLPTASTSTLGGVKVDGTTISISSGVISAASTLPGNAAGYLYNNGSGTLSWSTPSGGGGSGGSSGSGSGSSSVDVQTFNSTGTWTKPSGYAMARIQLWGGGAGGAKMAGARGGGGGGYNETTVPLSHLNSTVTITVGAGGLGRTGTAGNGGNGGTSSVPFSTALTNGSTAIYAYGGSGYLPGNYNLGGGQLGINSPSPANVSGFIITPLWNGGAGGETNNVSGCGSLGFAGFDAVFGGGGGGGESFAGGASVYGGAGGGVGGANGINGNAPGGGGMGSSGITDGGNGAAGRVVITCWGGGSTGGGGSSAAEVQTFNSTGTWTKPSGCKMARIQLWGGGGGGSLGSSAIGGAGGSYNEITVPLSYLADTVTATVGAGGAASTVVGYGSQGGGGTPSSFALATPVNGMSTVYGYGGQGGSGPSPSPFFNLGANGWIGGAGGWYDTGDALNGGSSIFGGGGGGNGLQSDPGGASLYGGAGGSSVGFPSTANFNGRVPGGGGVANGGNGAAGRIIVTCY